MPAILHLVVLHEFVSVHREEIILRCRAKVTVRSIPPPTKAEIDHGVPVFLDQLVKALRPGFTANPDIADSALQHGHDLLMQGFTVSQVVHDYGDVCQSITELAGEMNVSVSTDDFRALNSCLDDAIAGAVTEYGRARAQSTLEGEVARESERMGFLAHELRNLVNTAMLAFEVLKSGSVGPAGTTGGVLERSLLGLRALVGQSISAVRLSQGIQHRERLPVSEFIAEVASAAGLEAQTRNLTLVVPPVDAGISIEGDRQILAAVVSNLLQNAFKFTRPRSTVTLRVSGSAERVLIEVLDECQGLPSSKVSELFRPFEQRGVDRTGAGLGLAFSRWGADAHNGRIYARNLPERGCVFTLDLPRVPAPSFPLNSH
jgi:signal transduction histidine kinase